MENRKLELADITAYLPYGLKVQIGDYDEYVYCATEEYGQPIEDVHKNAFEISYIDTTGYILIVDEISSCDTTAIDTIKPILRPMSDITKPMTHPDVNGGEEFVPLIEVAKLFHYNRNWELSPNAKESVVSYSNVGSEMRMNTGLYLYWGLLVDSPNGVINTFGESYGGDGSECSFNPLVSLFLSKLNFDYNNLIGQGLAIDINTLKD